MAYEFKFVCSKCRSADVDVWRTKDLDLEAAGKIKLEMICAECHHVESLTQIEVALHWLKHLEAAKVPVEIGLEWILTEKTGMENLAVQKGGNHGNRL